METISSAVANHIIELQSDQERTSQSSPRMEPTVVISDSHLIYNNTRINSVVEEKQKDKTQNTWSELLHFYQYTYQNNLISVHHILDPVQGLLVF